MTLDGYLSVLDELGQRIKAVNKKIVVSAKDDEEASLLMTIPGVGYYSALLIKSEIGDINRFPSAKQLCGYTGLIASTYSSGDTTFHGHIVKQGSKWLRWITAEAIGHLIARPGFTGIPLEAREKERREDSQSSYGKKAFRTDLSYVKGKTDF